MFGPPAGNPEDVESFDVSLFRAEKAPNMIVEYLDSGSLDCPLIRIFGTRRSDFEKLLDGVLSLANGTATRVDLGTLFGPPSQQHCDIEMKKARRNTGVTGPFGDCSFEWSMTSHGWLSVADLIAPFATSPAAGIYQWIDHNAGEVSVLLSFSETGRW